MISTAPSFLSATSSRNRLSSTSLHRFQTRVPSESTADAAPETKPENTEAETIEEDELSDAPDFTMIDAEGNTVRLSDLRGKPRVINFWASWCPPCKAELPFFEEAYKEYMERVNFVMLNLTDGSQETVETASDYVTTEGYTFPLYFDTQMEGALAYGTYSIPVTVVVTADGKLFTQRVGGIPTKEILCDMFTPLLEE